MTKKIFGFLVVGFFNWKLEKKLDKKKLLHMFTENVKITTQCCDIWDKIKNIFSR
jgi:hypothetical protein